jgi:hypothetical protein
LAIGLQLSLTLTILSLTVSNTPVLPSVISFRRTEELLKKANKGYGPTVSVGMMAQLPLIMVVLLLLEELLVDELELLLLVSVLVVVVEDLSSLPQPNKLIAPNALNAPNPPNT